MQKLFPLLLSFLSLIVCFTLKTIYAAQCATAAKGFACWLVSFWFRVSGWPFILTSQLETTNFNFPSLQADGSNLATAAYVKDHASRIALLETKQIIALPIPESNRKSENSNSALRALPTSRGTSRTGKTRGTMNSGIHYGVSHLNQ